MQNLGYVSGLDIDLLMASDELNPGVKSEASAFNDEDST